MRNLSIIAVVSMLSMGAIAQQPSQTQQPSTEQQMQHEMPGMNMPQSQQSDLNKNNTQPPFKGPVLRLEDLEQMGFRENPTLRQADAEVRAGHAREQQAGLYPNPTIGYQGEQIRGGSFRGGEQGAFVQQDIVLGGKLGAAKNSVTQERKQAEAEREEQKLRILNGIRLVYYQALAAQETVALRASLVKVAQDAVETSKQLFNVGQSDQPDVLQAEVEADQAELALTAAQNSQQRMWKSLAAVVGNPELPFSPLAGNLEDIPQIDPQEWLQKLLTDSPAVKIAQLGVTRAQADLVRAKREPLPDLQLRGGVEQNRELIESSGRPAGLQGFAEVGVQIPLFNRNQGNIQAAKAEIERAQLESKRIQLLLRERLAATVQNYSTARATVDRYRNRMIPRAENAYKLYLQKYTGMTAAYPQVLIAQRTLFQLKADYVAALEDQWMNTIALKGFMLTDALEAPTSPGEMDRPVRETNLPMGSTGTH
jgi:cobalt-zinc-cadmium efflux system outer membrane protein